MGKSTQGEMAQGKMTHGQNDWRAKGLTGKTTCYRAPAEKENPVAHQLLSLSLAWSCKET